MKEDVHSPEGRLCDYCSAAAAVVFCRPDAARLCLRCDRDVHSTNPLFGRHSRSLLCDLCSSASSSIFCESHRSVLCSSCDWDAHDASATPHNRRPIEGFSGCPSSSEILAFLGFDDARDKDSAPPVSAGEFADSVLWETPAVISLDDLIVSSEDFGGLQAFDVPPLPKNRNATCGKRKEVILRQIRLLAKAETCLSFENVEVFESDNHFQDVKHGTNPGITDTGCDDHGDLFAVPDSEAVAFQWLNDNGDETNQGSNSLASLSSYHDEIPANHGKQPDTGCVSCGNESNNVQPENHLMEIVAPVPPKVYQYELNSQERESAISRYKEKRKTRRYEKHIRYESRKARAESRTRVKGRFAKIEHRV